jgi:ferritin-like metal-binding protein YciE
MFLFSRKLENLQQLFLKELRDIYDGENQVTEALPKLIEAAHHPELKNLLREHVHVTKLQISRLDRIFQVLNEKPTGEDCKGMKGLLKEGEEIASADGDPGTIDAGIITAAQRVEHYQIAVYGAVRTYAELMRTYAELLEQQEMASLLQETLDEKKEADQTLSNIAGSVNVKSKVA